MKKNAEIPLWLLESSVPLSSGGERTGHDPSRTGPLKKQRDRILRKGFVEKTIEGIADVLREEILAGQIARKNGLLQGLDPRIKVLTTLLLIVTVNFTRHAIILLVFNLWLIWLAKISRIPVLRFIKRVWLVIPLFTGVVVLPSLFNFVHAGTPLVTLFSFSVPHHIGSWQIPQTIAITQQGVSGAVVLLLRVGASVSLAVLLTLATRWNSLLKALRSVFVPQIFITVLEMTYRYIYLFLQSASEIFVARKSRMVGRTSTKEQRKFVSNAMGALWGKAYATSEEVYAAMLSRGYTGEPKTVSGFKTRMIDWMWVLFVVVVCLIVTLGDRILV